MLIVNVATRNQYKTMSSVLPKVLLLFVNLMFKKENPCLK